MGFASPMDPPSHAPADRVRLGVLTGTLRSAGGMFSARRRCGEVPFRVEATLPGGCGGRGRVAACVSAVRALIRRSEATLAARSWRDGWAPGLEGRRALVAGRVWDQRRIATALAGEGARVALIGRSRDRIDVEAARLDGSPVVADLATPGGPADAVAQAVAALGGLDLLVADSGGPPSGTFDTLLETDWEAAIAGTLQSVLRLVRAALPHLREGDDPAILIVLSSSVREPISGLTLSNVLRPGLAGLVKTLTAEIAPIRINGLAPGRNRHRAARLARCSARGGGRPHGRRGREALEGGHPARAVRRPGRDRAIGGVPALARGVVRDRRDRAGQRGHGPGAAVAGPGRGGQGRAGSPGVRAGGCAGRRSLPRRGCHGRRRPPRSPAGSSGPPRRRCRRWRCARWPSG